MRCWRPFAALVLGIAATFAALCGDRFAAAGDVTLKNGFIISGRPRRVQALSPDNVRISENETLSYPFVMIDNGYQRIFIPKMQAAKIEERDDLSKFETFRLKQIRNGSRRTSGHVVSTSPFNEFGRRTHKLQGGREIVVGVTKMTPKYLAISGINYDWNYGIATNSVPPDQLDLMIRKANDPKNPDHRFAIARFYLQAGLYDLSRKELESIAKDFPELAERVADSRKEVLQLEQSLVLQESRRLNAAGEHELAHTYLQTIDQKEASAAVLRDVSELLRDYDTGRERIAKVRDLLGKLQNQLTDPADVSAVMPLRSSVEAQLTVESLDRLQAFLNLIDDNTLKAADKLALAYSGWVVGSAPAKTDLHLAIRLWQAQQGILEYLRTENPQDRKDRLAEIGAIDGVGPDLVEKLLRYLPPTIETQDITPGVVGTISIAGHKSEKLPSYQVFLPPEYDWRHQYPLIVALHSPEHSTKAEIEWWCGTPAKPGLASRRGYIVIAPEWISDDATEYNYSVSAHDSVLRAMIDARRRFNIDSDRIFLSGHGLGGDAAFDMGMSHPDQFAGVIPINAICAQFCKWYFPNAAYTSWYVITGEFDGREPFTADSPTLSRMMQKGTDVVLVEFVQRGAESYFEETERIFDWMEPLRRQKPPRDFKMKVLRPSENHFFWIRADGLPQSVLQPVVLAGSARGTVTAMQLGAKIMPGRGNLIYLTSGAKSHTLSLSPDMIKFDQPLEVRHNGQRKFHGLVKPSIEALLEDYRFRADRQRLYPVRLDLG